MLASFVKSIRPLIGLTFYDPKRMLSPSPVLSAPPHTVMSTNAAAGWPRQGRETVSMVQSEAFYKHKV